MLEEDSFMPRKTPRKGAFRGLAKPHFNHFRLQTAPPLAKPYFRQMLFNGIEVKIAPFIHDMKDLRQNISLSVNSFVDVPPAREKESHKILIIFYRTAS
jgi:hypothetical protein